MIISPTSATTLTTLNIIQLQIELLITLQIINSPFHRNFHPSHHRRCQEDQQGSARGNSTKPIASMSTPTPTETPSQDSSADGGLHLGSSFGAVEYHGITSYQWATLLLLIIIVVWLNLRYRRKSRIASDAKRGILPPRAPPTSAPPTSGLGTRIFAGRSNASSENKNVNGTCSCARSTSTGGGQSGKSTPLTKPGPDIGQGPWIAHAMIKNQTTRRKKAKVNCWDNKVCGRPIPDSSDEEELKHQLVTIFQPSTSGIPLQPRNHRDARGDRRLDTPRPSPPTHRRDQSGGSGTGESRGGRSWTPLRPIATSKQSIWPGTTTMEDRHQTMRRSRETHWPSEHDLRRERDRIRSEMEHRTYESSFRPIRRGSTTRDESYSHGNNQTSSMSPIASRTPTSTLCNQPRTSTPRPRAKSEERSKLINSIMTDKALRSTTTTPASISGETPSPRTRTMDSPADSQR